MIKDLGPVQLIVFGFDKPKFGGGIAAEINRLKDRDIIRVIDALVIHKNAQGDVKSLQTTDLEGAEKFGAVIGGLLGLGLNGEAGVEAGAQAGAEAIREKGGHVFNAAETWDVLEDIPRDSAAALVLLEHRWAIPLRDSIRGEGGQALGDLWLHPSDLVAAGLIAAEVAEARR